jgi:hypothetical protein
MGLIGSMLAVTYRVTGKPKLLPVLTVAAYVREFARLERPEIQSPQAAFTVSASTEAI